MIKPMVEQMAPEMDIDEAVQEDHEPMGGDDGEVTYTVHDLAGYSNRQTMKVNGLLKRQQVTVLIDTNGGTLMCKSKYSNVKLTIQDQEL